MAEAQQENTEATDADLLRRANPFLARLLVTHLAGDASAERVAADLAEDPSDVEHSLRSRMRGTLEGAAAVLALVEARGKQGDGSGGAAACAGAGNSKDAQLAALNNLLTAESNRLRDQALQDATKIKQLQSSLAGVGWGGSVGGRVGAGGGEKAAGYENFYGPPTTAAADREDELLVAQRKAVQLKASSSGALGAAAAAAAVVAAASPAAPAGHDDAGRLHALLQKRGAELEEREAALIRADRWGGGGR
jgi:hypothetical protein